MNRERLFIMQSYLDTLPDDRVDMSTVSYSDDCGTVACIAGWTGVVAKTAGDFPAAEYFSMDDAGEYLGLTPLQKDGLFLAEGSDTPLDDLTRSDAIAAIQSMLDSPNDEALPVWPERAA